MHRLARIVATGLAVLGVTAVALPTPAVGAPRPAALKVMTRNLYLGADLSPVFSVGSPAELVAAATAIFATVEATAAVSGRGAATLLRRWWPLPALIAGGAAGLVWSLVVHRGFRPTVPAAMVLGWRDRGRRRAVRWRTAPAPTTTICQLEGDRRAQGGLALVAAGGCGLLATRSRRRRSGNGAPQVSWDESKRGF